MYKDLKNKYTEWFIELEDNNNNNNHLKKQKQQNQENKEIQLLADKNWKTFSMLLKDFTFTCLLLIKHTHASTCE